LSTIAFLIPTLAVGGAEKNTVSLANYFSRRGHSVLVFTAFDKLTLAHEFHSKVKVQSLGLTNLREVMFRISGLISDEHIDVIISNLWPLNLWVSIGIMISRRRLRTILVEHINLSVGLKIHSKFERFAAWIFHKFLIPANTQMIAVSNGVRTDLIQNMGVSQDKISMVYNPVLEMGLLKARSGHQGRIRGSKVSLLAVGNFKPQKDYGTMLRAMKILMERDFEFELKIAGDGFLRKSIELEIVKLGLTNHVTLLGEILDTGPLYSNSEIYILSSKWEGFGNTIVEALSYGCKVVSTNCPSGPSEILNAGSYGWLVPVGDPAALANAVCDAASAEVDLRAQYSHCIDFTDEIIGREYLQLCGL